MPNAKRTCQYFLLLYTPNIVRGEFINVGVFLYGRPPARLESRLLGADPSEVFARAQRLAGPYGVLALLVCQAGVRPTSRLAAHSSQRVRG